MVQVSLELDLYFKRYGLIKFENRIKVKWYCVWVPSVNLSLSSLLLPPAVPHFKPAALGLAIAAALEGKSGCGRGGEGARVLRQRRAAAEGLI